MRSPCDFAALRAAASAAAAPDARGQPAPNAIEPASMRSSRGQVDGDDFLPRGPGLPLRRHRRRQRPGTPELGDRRRATTCTARASRSPTSAASVQLGAPQFPAGQVKNDEYFGKQEVYHHELSRHRAGGARRAAATLELPLQVSYQGCAEAGLCYPPHTKTVNGADCRGRGAASTRSRRHAAAPVAAVTTRTGLAPTCATQSAGDARSCSSSRAWGSPSPPACCRWCRSSPGSSSAAASSSPPRAPFRSR